MLKPLSDGTATEPLWTPQTRTEYARRMHVVCSTLSIAIARTTANTLDGAVCMGGVHYLWDLSSLTLRCKCSHSWVDDYCAVPRALGCWPIRYLRLSSMLNFGFHTTVKCRPCLILSPEGRGLRSGYMVKKKVSSNCQLCRNADKELCISIYVRAPKRVFNGNDIITVPV